MVVILLLVPSSSASVQKSAFLLSTSYQNANRPFTQQSKSQWHANRNYTRESVNHITRINISNDYSQVETNDGEGDAVTHEGKLISLFTRFFGAFFWKLKFSC